MGLPLTAAVAGAAYLLGARAGRERYTQILAAGQRLAARPETQQLITALRAQTGKLTQPARTGRGELGGAAAPAGSAPGTPSRFDPARERLARLRAVPLPRGRRTPAVVVHPDTAGTGPDTSPQL